MNENEKAEKEILNNLNNENLRVKKLFDSHNYLWLPPPDLSVSEWADLNRRISPEASAEPGIWRTSRAEYQRGIMDAISDNQAERIVIMSSAQIGKTEILLNVIGYYIDQEPSPILILNPTLQMGQAFSKDRLAPMIRDTPCLNKKIGDPKSRNQGNTLLHKKFSGGHITISGANSAASLASRPIRVLLCDEVDRYPISAGAEGDPLSLAMKRTANFWNRKIVWVSTPTILGASRIEKAFDLSSCEEWEIPCPVCGEYNKFDWDLIVYKDVTEPVMKCKKCGALNNKVKWQAGQNKGIWRAGKPENKKFRGFHLNAFASPWSSWEELCEQYEEAILDSPEEVKVWTNTVLGLPYENKVGTIEVTSLDTHREEYKCEVPDQVLILTAGVDVQDDRFALEIVGWGLGQESWGILYKEIYGNISNIEVWNNLSEILLNEYYYKDGTALKIACTCIDSGGHFTDEVYNFVRKNKRNNIFAVKGSSNAGMPGVGRVSHRNKGRVPLFILGVNTLKGELYARLKIEKAGPGYCHFPKDFKNNNCGYWNNYFTGLLSERMVVHRKAGRDVITWEKRYRDIRNEPLDCRIYATGALGIIKPDLAKLSQKHNKSDLNNLQREDLQINKNKSVKRKLILRGGLKI